MIRLVVTAHSLTKEVTWKRWQILAEEYPVDVTLVVPEEWHSTWFNELDITEPRPVERENFRVIPLPTTNKKHWWRYLFKSLDNKLRHLDPDVIYSLHEEQILVNQQWITYRNVWARDAKFIFFTMNALGVSLEKWHEKFRWWHLRRNADAALGHYPGCKNSLRDAGFEKPIFMQTQIGLNEELFHPDQERRGEVREELGVRDKFVIGFTGRLVKEKGILDLLAAVPLEGVDWFLLVIGDGDLRDEVEAQISEKEIEDRTHLTGFIPPEEVARHMRAMDCYVLGSHTTEEWIDTFPLSPIQAMASNVPTVVSDSGALPYQVGDAGLVFPERDVDALEDHLEYLARNPEKRAEIGEECREHVMSQFSAKALADNFYQILVQVHTGEYEYADPDEEYTQHKAY